MGLRAWLRRKLEDLAYGPEDENMPKTSDVKQPWTPGPWVASPWSSIVGSAVARAVAPRGQPALLAAVQSSPYDARLIAKAPELAERLAEVLVELEAHVGGPQGQNEEEASMLARARATLNACGWRWKP